MLTGILIPDGFLVNPSEQFIFDWKPIEILRLLDNTDSNLIFPTSRSIMTDEGSVLAKVVSSMTSYHHCLWTFNINQ